MACTVMAYIVMAYIVSVWRVADVSIDESMAYIVRAYIYGMVIAAKRRSFTYEHSFFVNILFL